jgi:hypothetical protein
MKPFEVTCPHCQQAFAVEIPKVAPKRGQLFGIAVADMTDEQLKREIINSSSVLYKAKQRGADAATIAANESRLAAAKAEKDKRAGAAAANVVVSAPNVAATMEAPAGESPYNAEQAEQI